MIGFKQSEFFDHTGITLRLEERGTFSRNSAGDEATHLKVIRDGQDTSGSSVISLRKEGRSYVIDDARQQHRVVCVAGKSGAHQ